MKEIGAGKKFPFPKTTPCNIGNPQAVGQGHMTFNREVLSAAIFPTLLDADMIGEDAKNRVRAFRANSSPMGAYTGNSKGLEFVR
jgi:alanine transaminase